MNKAARLLMVGATSAALMAAGASPATADAASDATMPMCAPNEVSPAAASRHSWNITNVFGKATFHVPVGPPLHAKNHTNEKITSWFEAKVGGKVGVETHGEAGTDTDILISQLSFKLGVTVREEIYAEVGARIQVGTPAKHIAYAQWGVDRFKGSGAYVIISGQCSERRFPLTASAPYSTGWDTWVKRI